MSRSSIASSSQSMFSWTDTDNENRIQKNMFVLLTLLFLCIYFLGMRQEWCLKLRKGLEMRPVVSLVGFYEEHSESRRRCLLGLAAIVRIYNDPL
jgi:hypothetical protein